MDFKFQTLVELLANAYDLPHGYIYLQGDYPWISDTLGLVYSREEGDDLEVEHPEFFNRHKLKLALDVGTFQGIVYNANLQNPHVTLDQLVKAFNHYYRYDGYMNLLQ